MNNKGVFGIRRHEICSKIGRLANCQEKKDGEMVLHKNRTWQIWSMLGGIG
jgi:hypothetical protein